MSQTEEDIFTAPTSWSRFVATLPNLFDSRISSRLVDRPYYNHNDNSKKQEEGSEKNIRCPCLVCHPLLLPLLPSSPVTVQPVNPVNPGPPTSVGHDVSSGVLKVTSSSLSQPVTFSPTTLHRLRKPTLVSCYRSRRPGRVRPGGRGRKGAVQGRERRVSLRRGCEKTEFVR